MGAQRSIADEVREECAARSRCASRALLEAATCPVCGHPVVRGHGRVPRQLHRECRDFRNYVRAAAKQLARLQAAQQQRARRQLILAANAIKLPRRPDGRFVGARP